MTRWKKFAFLSSTVVFLLIAITLLCGAVLKGGDTVFPNVHVAGINVGGMEQAEAVTAVSKAAAASYGAQPLIVVLPDREITFAPERTKVSLDADAAVQAALSFGRDGDPFSVVRRYLFCKGTAHDVVLTNALSFDATYLQTLLEKSAIAASCALKQTEVSLDEDARVMTIQVGISGKRLDTDALYAAIVAAFSRNDFSPLPFSYEITPVAPVDLDAYSALLREDLKDAYYDAEAHTLVAEKNGFAFDLETVRQRVALSSEGETIIVSLSELEPEVTLAELEASLFPDTLATYDSPHVVNANRTHNLTLACAAIDGKILNPDEVFSFNKTVGERTAAKGYRPAIVYTTGGKSEPELGGGICQVASTLYMCTLLADLKVVDRVEHMYAVTYVPFGMDATVYWGSQDFKFRNNTQHPIRIRASVSGGYTHIRLLGVKETENYVKMTYKILETIPWSEEEVVDETQASNYQEVTQTPYTGYRVQTYKSIYSGDDQLISEDKCAYSNYKKRNKIITVGPAEPEPEPPAPPVNGTPPLDDPAAPDSDAVSPDVTDASATPDDLVVTPVDSTAPPEPAAPPGESVLPSDPPSTTG